MKWVHRLFLMGIGWYMAMAYPTNESPYATLLSLAIGSVGVLLVACTAYASGWEDRKP